jgi:hypothetical protein
MNDDLFTWQQNPGRLEQAFWKFHQANPHVYTVLVSLARRYRRRHPAARLGIGMLYEVARWRMIMGTDSEDGFKLSNNHRAFYARLIMRDEPDLAEAFETKEQKVASTLEKNS